MKLRRIQMKLRATCGYCGQGLDGLWDATKHYWLEHTPEGRLARWIRSKFASNDEP